MRMSRCLLVSCEAVERRPAVMVEERSKWYSPTFPIECIESGLKPLGSRFLCSIISGTTPASGFPPPFTLRINMLQELREFETIHGILSASM
jgi:hypothetical protein